MASASATKTFGDRVSISTAGVAAYGQQATKDAVTLVQQRYGIDISMHVSRDVATLADLTCYDYIIAMHPDIATRLTAQWHVDHTKEARQNNLTISSINVVCLALCRTPSHRLSQRSLPS